MSKRRDRHSCAESISVVFFSQLAALGLKWTVFPDLAWYWVWLPTILLVGPFVIVGVLFAVFFLAVFTKILIWGPPPTENNESHSG